MGEGTVILGDERSRVLGNSPEVINKLRVSVLAEHIFHHSFGQLHNPLKHAHEHAQLIINLYLLAAIDDELAIHYIIKTYFYYVASQCPQSLIPRNCLKRSSRRKANTALLKANTAVLKANIVRNEANTALLKANTAVRA